MKNETRADKKFHRVLREYYRNELRSSNGKRVTDRERAIAIAFSEARKIDPKYHITKHANGTKIKIDNTLQLIFEDAWKHYWQYIKSISDETQHKTFEQWLRTTNDGLKYNKRMAQLIRNENIIAEPQMNERGAKISNNDEHRGGKIRGHLHRNGGVRAIIVDTHEPVEVERDELIITKGVARSDDNVICEGKPEGIASRLNEKYGGDKISNQPATCHLKTEIMERGKKIKQFIGVDDESKIKRQIEREQQLKNNEMENGAKIELHDNDVIIKINESKEFEIVCFLKNKNFHYSKILKYDDVCIYKSNDLLVEFLDKNGIHYTEFDNKQEFDEWLLKQLPSRIKNKLQ